MRPNNNKESPILIPPKEADFVLFSMCAPDGIMQLLRNFRQQGDACGISSTVIWTSGEKNFNVPVEPFSSGRIGYVFQPERIVAPQGDIWANGICLTQNYKNHAITH